MTWTREKAARLRELLGDQLASDRNARRREAARLALEAADVLDRAMDAATAAAVSSVAAASAASKR